MCVALPSALLLVSNPEVRMRIPAPRSQPTQAFGNRTSYFSQAHRTAILLGTALRGGCRKVVMSVVLAKRGAEEAAGKMQTAGEQMQSDPQHCQSQFPKGKCNVRS